MWEPVEVVGLLARAGLLTGLGLRLATTTRPWSENSPFSCSVVAAGHGDYLFASIRPSVACQIESHDAV